MPQQSAPKRPKLNKLPAIPKKAPGSSTDPAGPSGRDSPDSSAPKEPWDETEGATPSGGSAGFKRPSAAPLPSEGGDGDEKIDGFSRTVYEALQRIFVETDLQSSDLEEKVMNALRALTPSYALKALDQFQSEDMSRMRNKGAYLWGIVRNIKEGRSHKPQEFNNSRYPPRDQRDSGVVPVSGTKLLWPEEERAIAEADVHEGKMIEKEFTFDNISCSLPAAESLFSEVAHLSSFYGELKSIKETLHGVQQHIDGIDVSEWNKTSSNVALAGRVVPLLRQLCKPEMCTTEWAQAFEVLSAHPVVPASCTADEKLKSLHLCEAFGAMVCALNHFLRTRPGGGSVNWEWLAHKRSADKASADAPNVTASVKPRGTPDDGRFVSQTQEHWVMGTDGAGDLTDQKGIQHLWKTARPKGPYHVVTIDRRDILTSETWSSEQEASASQALFGQMVTGLGVLANGGSLVIKGWTMFEHTGVGIMYLLNCSFDEVVACRPATMTAGTGELFVVCTGFKGLSQVHLDALLAVAGPEPPTQDGEPLTMIPGSFLPSAWMAQMQTCSRLFARLQTVMVERDLRLYSDLKPAEKTQIFNMRDQVAQQWKSRFDCRPLTVHDRIVRESLSTAPQHKFTASPGGKTWYSIRGRFVAPGAKTS